MRKFAPELAAVMITFFIGTSASLLLDTFNTDVVTSSCFRVENVRRKTVLSSASVSSQNTATAPVSGRIIAEVVVSENGMVVSDNPRAMFRKAEIVPAVKSRFPQQYTQSGGENIKLRRIFLRGFNLY